MTEINYMRGSGFFNPENQNINLKIFGVGSVGSLLTLNLAKMGFSDICVFDFDKIESHNIPNQFYKISDIGRLKTDSLKDIINEFTGIEISTVNEKITEENVDNLIEEIDINSLIVFAFDNLEVRKLVYNRFKGFPNKLIDIRMGGKDWSIQIVTLDNESECKEYESSLNKPTVNLVCGMQSIIFTLSNIASEVSNLIVKINNQENYKTLIKRNLDSYRFLVN